VSHSCEIRGKMVVLALRPALERMVVAFIAREPDAQEKLSHVLSGLVRVFGDAEIARCRVLVSAAFGRNDFANELIVRSAAGDLRWTPAHTLRIPALPKICVVALEKARPFLCPVVAVGWAVEQLVHQSAPLPMARSFVGEESANLLRLRRKPRQIERAPPHK